MKKKIIVLSILLILIIPFSTGVLKDGGTRVYSALTYKIVCWNRITGNNGIYNKTKIYPFPLNFLSLNSLYNRENVDNKISFFTDNKTQETTTPETKYPDIGVKFEEPTIESIGFSAYYFRTYGYTENAEYPQIKIIRSSNELEKYYSNYQETYDVGSDSQTGPYNKFTFSDFCKKYDDKYFEEQILILVLLEEGSGAIHHAVENLEYIADNDSKKLSINIDRLVPECGTDDMAYWHIFIEPKKEFDIENEQQIEISFSQSDVNQNDMYISKEQAMIIADLVKKVDNPPINAIFDTTRYVWYVFCHKEGEPDGMADEGHQTIMVSGNGDFYLIDPIFIEWGADYEN